MGVSRGDTAQTAQQLAAKVLSLNLFPELMDPDTAWSTNVVDNGGEVLVLLQQTLCATFPKRVPSQERALPLDEARPVFEAFVAKLKEGYQEEMVVAAPLKSPSLRVEMMCEGSGVFELGTPGAREPLGPPVAKAKAKANGKPAAPAGDDAEQMLADVAVVTRALRRAVTLPRSKAVAESKRVFQVLGLPKLRDSLAEAKESDTDAFAEALDSAASFFTAKQQEQITEWTGLAITAEPLDEEAEDNDHGAGGEEAGDDDLEKQLAELRGEIADPLKGINAAKKRRAGVPVKEEAAEEKQDGPRGRPDWTGRAAPETPAALAARQWAANRRGGKGGGAGPPQASWASGGKGLGKAGGKGKAVRPPRRALGIVSLDGASRLHGNTSGGYQYGQHTKAYVEQAFSNQSGAEPPAKKARELPKGTPTVAPMCPAPTGETEEDL